MFDVFSMPARSAVTRAHSEARRHGNDYIGTEHLLLGVLEGGGDDAVGKTLRSFRLTGEAIRSRVEDMIGPVGEPQPGHAPFSPRAKSALERSRYEAQVPGHGQVEPPHIFAALMWQDQSAAAKAVASLGVKPTAIREHVLSYGQNTDG
ncbi:MAG TPA: Clp protease N-terminal domain-containing protein [Mycobacterium sp.]|uniref:Clp protease N-terminal domain-containing protein n=1 Tax=Mycobacterium sp. TaxID=1785 RepID=UPI002F4258FC